MPKFFTIVVAVCLVTTFNISANRLNAFPNNTLVTLAFDHKLVDTEGPQNIWLKTVGDLNGDGQTDLIAGGNAGGGLVWYEAPTWSKHQISSEVGFGTDGEVADVDGDGDQDVVVLTTSDLRWYENPSWIEHIIDSRVLHDVEVSDLDGDGDMDIVARGQTEFASNGNLLHFYRQDNPMSWTYRGVNCSNGEGLKLTDIDRDGDTDVVIEGTWFENTGNIVGNGWTAYIYTTSWTHPSAYVNTGDINGNGRMDVVLSPAELAGQDYRISWFEAPVNVKSSGWTEHIVDENVEAVHHFVGVADMDNDGDADIAAAEMAQGSDADEIKVYLNMDGVGNLWTKQVLATTGSHSMRLVDVGEDGDQDLYGANWQSNQVELWESQICHSRLNNWQRHVIDSAKPWRTIFITAADMDQDGWQDVITGGWWYKNPGNPGGDWDRLTIGSPLDNMAAVSDFDGDGLPDVVGTMGQGSDPDGRLVWAHNKGSGTFDILDNLEPGVGDFLQGVAVGKLLDEGSQQVALSWHAPGNGIQALSVPAQPLADHWTMQTLSTNSQDEALSMGDIDRDGDQDLLLGTIWLENTGSSWVDHTLHETADAPYGESDPDRNRLTDFNKDGRLDALIGYEAISVLGKLAWYEQASNPAESWQEHVIASVVGPMSLDVADMDQDGDLDVIVGEHNLDDPASAHLILFENADGNASQWLEHLVYQGDEHHDGAQVVDIDNDGDLDILSIGWGHDSVILYENTNSTCLTSPQATPTPTTVAPSPVPTATSTPVGPTEVPVTPTAMSPGRPLPCVQGFLILSGILLFSKKIFDWFVYR